GLRQIDVAAHHGGAVGADHRNGESQWRANRGPAFRNDVRVSAVHEIDVSLENVLDNVRLGVKYHSSAGAPARFGARVGAKIPAIDNVDRDRVSEQKHT